MFKKIALTTLLAGLVFQAQAESLTVISFGGLNKDAQDKAFYKPVLNSPNIMSNAPYIDLFYKHIELNRLD